jgi:deazaflavin-dependent oxidoreductase (nitroreductase family)
MPMPLWWGHVNKRVFNPRELRKATRPYLTHIGRTSGNSYRVPLDAHPIPGGFVFILVYGSQSDWVQNILKSGTATLRFEGDDIDLTAPKVIDSAAAWNLLPASTKRPPGWLRIGEFLQMDRAT